MMMSRHHLTVVVLWQCLFVCCCWWNPQSLALAFTLRWPQNTKSLKTSPTNNELHHQNHHQTVLKSTPFEAGLYDTDDGDEFGNPYEDSPSPKSNSPLKVPPDTKLVVGLNKYSHDTTLCAANAKTGQVLFAMAKERLSRVKHDAGNVATLVETCCEALELDLDAIETVVMNNHHHRILPLEKNTRHMEWECGLQINGGAEDGYDDDYNLLPDATTKMELSHHLAHAYSAAAQCPFDTGMIVIMDGMGETYRTMMRAKEMGDESYVSDFTDPDDDEMQLIPSDLPEQSRNSYFDWREAETVYTFTKERKTNQLHIKPIFKRFTPERSPPTLYNHGFENMDSLGALYSRASSDIFGDWNACGKVMGLAPWMVHSWSKEDDDDDNENTTPIVPRKETKPILKGSIYLEDPQKTLQIDRSLMAGEPLTARSDPELFDEHGNFLKKRRYDFDDNDGSSSKTKPDKLLPTQIALDAITLASRMQTDLEDVVMDFVKHFQEQTKQKNLCLAGGVGLNSVLNGRLARELGFEKTFIPPYPGDDGIAVGCCAFALYGKQVRKPEPSIQLWSKPLSPYLGPAPTEYDIKMAIEDAAPWLEVETIRNEDRRVELMAEEVASGAIVAWYQGRSELGPRALGHRSILADPRKKGLVRFINQHVKKRETFRPFAPSALAEEAHDWFDLGSHIGSASDDPGSTDDHPNNVSPYMSMTAFVKEDKRAMIPAVTHVDGSSRLQTVTKEAEPLYHKFISKFFKKTGVPMVLNTSFNTLPGEPIVETPQNAIRSFLCSMGSIEMLVMGDYIIRRKQPDLRKLLGEVSKYDEIVKEPACPKRAGPANFQATFALHGDERDEESIEPATKVCMPDRPMHDERTEGWFELADEFEGEILSACDGTITLNEILAQYTVKSSEDDDADQPSQSKVSDSQILAENAIQRLVRLYEHTLIHW
ncbi:Nodulation protein [Seminavis robusta]|uniref:Nodulation protein n=1 Tax=Seminavis robusta TaxID=568900 RepID=A0A9N8HXQ2_9STRA|nr:Nodulation protein [Seminavis robusta]|eukprot:Sro2276_g321650.1 Nodulation protein (937) ;mRNA; f:6873-9683